MKKPTQRKAADLQHPKGTYKAWNGDVRQRGSTRWNGAPAMEDQGFATRGLVTVTHATTPQEPWKAKPVRTVGAVQPPSNGGRMHYERPLSLDTDTNRIVRGHHPTVRRWLGVLEEFGQAPADVLAALRYVGLIETSSSTQSGD